MFLVTEETQSQPQPDTPAKKGPEKLSKPVVEKPAKPALERPSKTTIKPAPSDSFAKQGSEKSSKSPPPPPPRKTYPGSSSGMTTTRSGEVVFISRKESVSSQVSPMHTPSLWYLSDINHFSPVRAMCVFFIWQQWECQSNSKSCKLGQMPQGS